MFRASSRGRGNHRAGHRGRGRGAGKTLPLDFTPEQQFVFCVKCKSRICPFSFLRLFNSFSPQLQPPGWHLIIHPDKAQQVYDGDDDQCIGLSKRDQPKDEKKERSPFKLDCGRCGQDVGNMTKVSANNNLHLSI
jgi:hypothetical protein